MKIKNGIARCVSAGIGRGDVYRESARLTSIYISQFALTHIIKKKNTREEKWGFPQYQLTAGLIAIDFINNEMASFILPFIDDSAIHVLCVYHILSAIQIRINYYNICLWLAAFYLVFCASLAK